MAEPIMSRRRQQTAPIDRRSAGRPRGMEESMRRQPEMEQERPYLAVHVGRSDTYKPMAKWCSCREGVRGAHSTVDARQQTEWREGALLRSRLARGGTCEGMTVTSNNPVDKARELQRQLFTPAKRNSAQPFSVRVDRSGSVTTCWRPGRVQPARRACRVRRSSVSRVREIRTHGLNGGLRW